jgi:hypothetical protein
MVFDSYRLGPGGQDFIPTNQFFLEFVDIFLPKLAAAGLEMPETISSTLCDQCADITLSKLKESGGYMLFDDVFLIEDSASKCDMCQMILLALRIGAGVSPYGSSLNHLLKERDRNGLPSLSMHLDLERGAESASIYLKLDGAALSIDIRGGGYRGFHPFLKLHAQPGEASVTTSNTSDIFVGSPAIAAGIPAGLPIHREPNTEGHFFLFREWIRHCVEEHE